MHTIGLIGGMSWESSALYYRWINEGVKERLGGLHSAEMLMYSMDFAEIERLQHEGRWEEAAALLVEAARKAERGGAEFLVLCTNTMHKVADEITSSVGIPLLHIADATAEEIKDRGFSRVGLLATGFTMEQDFYKGRLTTEHGLEVLVPKEEQRRLVHDVIYDELCLGEVRQPSRESYRKIMSHLVERGAEAIILGCTEITMLVGKEDATVPLFDTTAIHARKAVEAALEDEGVAALNTSMKRKAWTMAHGGEDMKQASRETSAADVPVTVERLDHLVLTVRDIGSTCAFYERVLSMRRVSFEDGKHALTFGDQKINLHEAGQEFEPKAARPTPGSADLCFVTRQDTDGVVEHLGSLGVEIVHGPVEQTGALGRMVSVYFRDPDWNLIEVSTYGR